MVRLTWSSALRRGGHSRGSLVLWVCLLYRWSFTVCAASGLRVAHAAKAWTVLSSPKCHKVGRLQLAHREALYSVSFVLQPSEAALGMGGACALSQLLLRLSAGFGHGLLQLREAAIRVPCQVHVFEASMCWLLA